MKLKSGFSLLELIIAMSLSSLVIAAFMHLYLVAKDEYLKQKSFAALQQNIRLSYSLLQRAIDGVGYAGCAALSDLSEIPTGEGVKFTFSAKNRLRGIDSGHVPDYLHGKLKSNSDGFVVQGAATNITKPLANIAKGVSYIEVGKSPVSKSNNLVLISDCQHAELLAVRNYIGNRLELFSPTKFSYTLPSSELSTFTETAYFVSHAWRKDSRGHKIYGLYRVINGGKRKELLEGISDMHIEYGVKEDGKISYYSLLEMGESMWNRVKELHFTLEFSRVYGKTKVIDFYLTFGN